ncbi:hypothetical protein McanCB21832_005242 [Microsporum canis]
MALNTIAVNNLSPGHLDAFSQAFHCIFSTDHAVDVLAQIVNGKPARDIDFDIKTNYKLPHPIRLSGPSEEDFEIAKRFQKSLRADVLEIKSSETYQNTTLGSREFKIRLLEMTAVAVHSVAGAFFSSRGHDPPPPKADDSQPPSPPTYLYHQEYLDYERNPLGVADTVGYWTELKVFGGIVIFDRGESEQEAIDPYIHPKYPYMIYKLSKKQLDSFIDFRTSKDHSDPIPIPFVTEKYAPRVDPEHAIEKHVFRDKNERRPLWMRRTGRTVHRRYMRDDFPELVHQVQKILKEKGMS